VRASVESAIRTGGSIGAAVTKTVVRRANVVALATLDAVLDSRLAGEAVERIAASPLAGRALRGALEGPELERAVAAALESPMVDRLIGRAIQSRLLDETVARLLDSDDLWRLVDEIARSPAVAAAIAQQSAGFADELASGVRVHSGKADAWLEQRARRVLRRRPVPRPGPETG
jgi:hypothetical protein